MTPDRDTPALRALRRLLAAKRAQTPADGSSIDEAIHRLTVAARADVPPPVTTWSLDVVRS